MASGTRSATCPATFPTRRTNRTFFIIGETRRHKSKAYVGLDELIRLCVYYRRVKCYSLHEFNHPPCLQAPATVYYRVGHLSGIAQRLVSELAQTYLANRLLPPGLEAGAEVGLGPAGEHDDISLVDVGVREGEGQGRGAADHLTLVVVLGAVARALELVLSLVPGHDAAEVGAHGVEAVILDGAVILDDDVGGVTLCV